ncbi:MAG: YbaK/EbsC family protein [bacterium]|nr:YbaK/EbsC family protein [bacterium]
MIETSPVFEKIKKLLDDNGITYQLFEHEPVFTSEQAARIRDTNIYQGAKAMIFSADGLPILIVVPGNRRVDTKTFKQLYKIEDLRLLSADEVKKLTGLEVGAIPPFGNVMGLPTYLDQGIVENESIVFSAGAHTKSIQMKVKDFITLVQPTINNLSI